MKKKDDPRYTVTPYETGPGNVTRSNQPISTPRKKTTPIVDPDDEAARQHLLNESSRVNRKLSQEIEASLDEYKRNERIQIHLNTIVQRVFSFYGYADCKTESAKKYIDVVIGALPNGYDSTDWTPLSDEEVALHELGSLHDLRSEDKTNLLNRTINCHRKRRQRFIDRQEKGGVDILHYKTENFCTDGVTRSQGSYMIEPGFTEMLRDLQAACPVGCGDGVLNRAIRIHCEKYEELFQGSAKRKVRKKREPSADADVNQSKARLKTASGKISRRPDAPFELENTYYRFLTEFRNESKVEVGEDSSRAFDSAALKFARTISALQTPENPQNSNSSHQTGYSQIPEMGLVRPEKFDGENGISANTDSNMDMVGGVTHLSCAPLNTGLTGTRKNHLSCAPPLKDEEVLTRSSINNVSKTKSWGPPEYPDDPDWRGDF